MKFAFGTPREFVNQSLLYVNVATNLISPTGIALITCKREESVSLEWGDGAG